MQNIHKVYIENSKFKMQQSRCNNELEIFCLSCSDSRLNYEVHKTSRKE